MDRIRIRRAGTRDAARLTRIAHAAKRYWGYPERLIALWGADLTVTPARVAGQPVYCAVHGRTIVGFYALSGTRTARELEHMWVAPAHIGRGVGALLFAHLVRRLRAMRVTRLTIAADPNAEGFYRRMGARRAGSVSSTPSPRSLPLLVLRLRPVVTPPDRARSARASA